MVLLRLQYCEKLTYTVRSKGEIAAQLHSIILKPRVILMPKTERRNAQKGVQTRIKWVIFY